MTSKKKREFDKTRNPVARDMNERRGAFKLRAVHPKKREKPKKITMADIRKGDYNDEDDV